MTSKNILLIITGSIAAYKSLELIRRLREQGHSVTPVLTKAAEQFVTSMSAAALAEREVYTDLFSLKNEVEMGHIRLAREHDVILVAPASADMLAKMVHGRADDLASAVLLAAQVPVFVAPAMNHAMWEHKATQRNVRQLQADGVQLIEPESGQLACGEEGQGRMVDISVILQALQTIPPPCRGEVRRGVEQPLGNKKVLVTAGPTFEAIDPVRFIGNRSSGKQGYAIAGALAAAGASVTLVSGPTSLPVPQGVQRVDVESSGQMLEACKAALPVDIAICAAAVSDWRVDAPAEHKMKKRKSDDRLTLNLQQTPDILASLAIHAKRPELLIGFAAETENMLEHARKKRFAKGCDWVLANDVSDDKVFGKSTTHLHLITEHGQEDWGAMDKQIAARRLVDEISSHFLKQHSGDVVMLEAK